MGKLFGAKPLMKETIAEPAAKPGLLKNTFGKKPAVAPPSSLMKRLTGK